ncbi:NAD(P)/FAD-dependent oxidoreductase [Tropicimonas sp. IMCC6043]|uniref:flavin-containing monooxygenase n=1 Tax=Tropicimonas sp. IMCC6043 TaxID=2510645 RepID=UPI00101DDAEC|nr:NAD(P)/FAD-dependent oxidoreductase [Tropicimonas sp. IMCC6043]RYH10358.1 NAD(P)/FAD-dependent oxidoreductase [Tropicimonas sp. IMCC6043]
MRAIVIGAGPAGLASAACLKRRGFEVEMLERAGAIGARWRQHYESLRLHTSRARSSLPGLKMPRQWPRYVSRAQLVDYLDDYAAHFDLHPTFGAEVRRVSRELGGWCVAGSMGEREAEVVVFASGVNDRPRRPEIAGLESFPGTVLHSSDYRRPADLPGQRVLILGFGNSAGDIALDMLGDGRDVAMVVRSPVNIAPRELLGIPITSFELLTRLLPYRLADRLTAPILRAAIGSPEEYGLVSRDKGPAAQVIEDGRIPLIDMGILAEIRAGRVTLRPALRELEGSVARFADGTGYEIDALLLATGYQLDLRPLLPGIGDVLDAVGRPLVSGGRTAATGLYFCSYVVSANGQLRQMSREAEAIARDAAQVFRP